MADRYVHDIRCDIWGEALEGEHYIYQTPTAISHDSSNLWFFTETLSLCPLSYSDVKHRYYMYMYIKSVSKLQRKIQKCVATRITQGQIVYTLHHRWLSHKPATVQRAKPVHCHLVIVLSGSVWTQTWERWREEARPNKAAKEEQRGSDNSWMIKIQLTRYQQLGTDNTYRWMWVTGHKCHVILEQTNLQGHGAASPLKWLSVHVCQN